MSVHHTSIEEILARPQHGRTARRAAEARERRALKGDWGPWRRQVFAPLSLDPSAGWSKHITEAAANDLYSVLIRRLPTEVINLAIRTISHREPPWRDLQRIKDELFGPDSFAVQVYPTRDRLVDGADMYHLWIMPLGYEPGFGLDARDEGGQ